MTTELADVAKGLVTEDEELLQMMISDLQSLNKIAVLKEEDNVIKELFRGKSRTAILKDLQAKYPTEGISKKVLNDFLLLYKDVLNTTRLDMEKSYVKRLIKSKTGLTNKFIDLANKAEAMADQFLAQEDNTNAIGALRTVGDMYMKLAKVEGLANDKNNVDINIQMDKVVAEVSAGDSDFKNMVRKAMQPKEPETIDAEFEVEEDGRGKEDV